MCEPATGWVSDGNDGADTSPTTLPTAPRSPIPPKDEIAAAIAAVEASAAPLPLGLNRPIDEDYEDGFPQLDDLPEE